MSNPLEDLVVARATTIGNQRTSLYVIQTQLRTYLGSSLDACRQLVKDREDDTSINAAGPASMELRIYVARVFSEIGFFS